MPTALRTEAVTTLREYTELVESEMAAGEPLWSRGVGDASYKLLPSLFRHPVVVDADELLDTEHRLLQRFRERSVPYQEGFVRLSDKWDTMFVMQHFGVPTRLLDWSENPFVSLFFAVTSAPLDAITREPEDPAAVWFMRPETWNRKALSDVGYDRGILSTDDSLLAGYKHDKGGDGDMRMFPVGMYGLHNSPRIVAQRGVFTIFGKSNAPLEDQFALHDYPAESLIKVELPTECVYPLREQLAAIGMTDSVIYPDLAGLGLELRRYFGFSL